MNPEVEVLTSRNSDIDRQFLKHMDKILERAREDCHVLIWQCKGSTKAGSVWVLSHPYFSHFHSVCRLEIMDSMFSNLEQFTNIPSNQKCVMLPISHPLSPFSLVSSRRSSTIGKDISNDM